MSNETSTERSTGPVIHTDKRPLLLLRLQLVMVILYSIIISVTLILNVVNGNANLPVQPIVFSTILTIQSIAQSFAFRNMRGYSRIVPLLVWRICLFSSAFTYTVYAYTARYNSTPQSDHSKFRAYYDCASVQESVCARRPCQPELLEFLCGQKPNAISFYIANIVFSAFLIVELAIEIFLYRVVSKEMQSPNSVQLTSERRIDV